MECPECNGTGEVDVTGPNGEAEIDECSECGGTGEVDDEDDDDVYEAAKTDPRRI